jgi:glycerophosphoryl diester phosphodiesterase
MPRQTLVFGHRGAMGSAPENSLASFKLAHRAGADGLECDVHLSKDGQLIVIHDEKLDRTTRGRGLVKSKTWRQLKSLDNGLWYGPKFRNQKLLRLQDLLAWLKNKKTKEGVPLVLLIEIKNSPVRYPRIAEAVVTCLKANHFVGRALVFSFDHAVVRRVKRLCPDLQTGIIFSKRLKNPAARARWAGARAVFPRYTLVTKTLAAQMKRAGLFLGTWTVNHPKDMKKMLRLGLNGITTNFPGALRKLLR